MLEGLGYNLSLIDKRDTMLFLLFFLLPVLVQGTSSPQLPTNELLSYEQQGLFIHIALAAKKIGNFEKDLLKEIKATDAEDFEIIDWMGIIQGDNSRPSSRNHSPLSYAEALQLPSEIIKELKNK